MKERQEEEDGKEHGFSSEPKNYGGGGKSLPCLKRQERTRQRRNKSWDRILAAAIERSLAPLHLVAKQACFVSSRDTRRVPAAPLTPPGSSPTNTGEPCMQSSHLVSIYLEALFQSNFLILDICLRALATKSKITISRMILASDFFSPPKNRDRNREKKNWIEKAEREREEKHVISDFGLRFLSQKMPGYKPKKKKC